jgi:ABC-2 type transport system ATP-binding protein
VINKGELVLVEDKDELMRKLGRKQLTLQLQTPLERIPPSLERHGLQLVAGGCEMIYTYDAQADRDGIASLLRDLAGSGIAFRDLHTSESSLEDIFVDLVSERR